MKKQPIILVLAGVALVVCAAVRLSDDGPSPRRERRAEPTLAHATASVTVEAPSSAPAVPVASAAPLAHPVEAHPALDRLRAILSSHDDAWFSSVEGSGLFPMPEDELAAGDAQWSAWIDLMARQLSAPRRLYVARAFAAACARAREAEDAAGMGPADLARLAVVLRGEEDVVVVAVVLESVHVLGMAATEPSFLGLAGEVLAGSSASDGARLNAAWLLASSAREGDVAAREALMRAVARGGSSVSEAALVPLSALASDERLDPAFRARLRDALLSAVKDAERVPVAVDALATLLASDPWSLADAEASDLPSHRAAALIAMGRREAPPSVAEIEGAFRAAGDAEESVRLGALEALQCLVERDDASSRRALDRIRTMACSDASADIREEALCVLELLRVECSEAE